MSDAFYCSFCRHTREEVRRRAGGREPGVYICNDCATLFDEQMKERKETGSGEAGTGDGFRCSFCGHTQEDGRRHAARGQEPDVSICDRCVEVRRHIMENRSDQA